jgi:uncharacterized protein (TIGR03067 family)
LDAQPKSKQDLEKLQGVWNIVALEADGKEVPAPTLAGARITIQGDHFTSNGMGSAYEGTIAIDASQTPGTFNFNFTVGPEKGNTSLGIYELNGDTWRICMTTRGGDRPRKFATQAGTGLVIETLKRSSGAAAPDFANVHFEPVPELTGEWSMVSGILDGVALEPAFTQSGRRVVEASEMTVFFGSQVYSKAKFTVDRSKSPRAIDLYNTQGGNAGKTQYGIYELNRETLKICYAAPGQERPRDFGSQHGDMRTFTVWSRAGK